MSSPSGQIPPPAANRAQTTLLYDATASQKRNITPALPWWKCLDQSALSPHKAIRNMAAAPPVHLPKAIAAPGTTGGKPSPNKSPATKLGLQPVPINLDDEMRFIAAKSLVPTDASDADIKAAELLVDSVEPKHQEKFLWLCGKLAGDVAPAGPEADPAQPLARYRHIAQVHTLLQTLHAMAKKPLPPDDAYEKLCRCLLAQNAEADGAVAKTQTQDFSSEEKLLAELLGALPKPPKGFRSNVDNAQNILRTLVNFLPEQPNQTQVLGLYKWLGELSPGNRKNLIDLSPHLYRTPGPHPDGLESLQLLFKAPLDQVKRVRPAAEQILAKAPQLLNQPPAWRAQWLAGLAAIRPQVDAIREVCLKPEMSVPVLEELLRSLLQVPSSEWLAEAQISLAFSKDYDVVPSEGDSGCPSPSEDPGLKSKTSSLFSLFRSSSRGQGEAEIAPQF